MIKELRRKFIFISGISIFLVFVGIFVLISAFSMAQMDRTMDTLTDAISSNDGVFPEFDPTQPSQPFPYDDIINEETRFSTRFFTVWVDALGRITRINIDSISSISFFRWRTVLSNSSISLRRLKRLLEFLNAPPVMEPPGFSSSPSRVTRRRVCRNRRLWRVTSRLGSSKNMPESMMNAGTDQWARPS